MNSIQKNVLVIEDDKDTGEYISKVLRNSKNGVRLVESRDEALLVLHRYLYDVVVMDYFMNGLTPESFIQILEHECPGVKLLLISSNDLVPSLAHRLGAQAYLGKPFTPEAFLNKLREMSPGHFSSDND